MSDQSNTRTRKKKFFFYAVIGFLPVAFLLTVYLGYTAYRSKDFYNYVKGNQRGWAGKVHKADPDLGYSPIPNSSGKHLFPIGPHIPMRYDEYGFRVPLQEADTESPDSRPVIMALGCSFTYGDAAYAKDTYPYLVGQILGGSTRNAGVCSYGLSQMLLLSERLIPEFKPDYLLVQYSPWLVGRAKQLFADSVFGKIPSPYFWDNGEDLALHPPVFKTRIVDLSVDRYRIAPKGLFDAVDFFTQVGLPLLLHDDLNMVKYKIKSTFGLLPAPTKAGKKLVQYVYGEIQKTAEENGAQMVIVILGHNAKSVAIAKDMFPPGALIINAHEALLNKMSRTAGIRDDKVFQRMFAHWRGDPPRLVDPHPNILSHRIIAHTIAAKIKSAQLQEH